MNRILRNAVFATLAATAFGVATAQTLAENPTIPAPKHEKQAPKVERNLKVFDALDFDVFSNQKWDRLKESHSIFELGIFTLDVLPASGRGYQVAQQRFKEIAAAA